MKRFFSKKSSKSPKPEMGGKAGGSCCSEGTKAGPSVIATTFPEEDEASDIESEDDQDQDDVADLPETPKNYDLKKNRQSVSAEAYGNWNKKKEFKAPVYPKTDVQRQRIRKTIQGSFMFSCLDESDLKTVIDAFVETEFKAGATIITQGDDGDCLYLLEDGECEVFKKKAGETEAALVFVQKPGDAFGELALLYNCPRAATVKAKGPVVLWRLDRESFNNIVKDAAARKRELHEGFLAEVELLKDMDPYERSKLADALKTIFFFKDDVIIKEGDAGDVFYMIESGEAEAVKGGETVMKYKRGDYFGELALVKDQPGAATVIAKDDVKCVALDRRSFKRLLGPVQGILKRNEERYQNLRRQLSGQVAA